MATTQGGYTVSQAGNTLETREAMRGLAEARLRREEMRDRSVQAKLQHQRDMEKRTFEHDMQQRAYQQWLDFINGPFSRMDDKKHAQALETLRTKHGLEASRNKQMLELMDPLLQKYFQGNETAMDKLISVLDREPSTSEMEKMVTKFMETLLKEREIETADVKKSEEDAITTAKEKEVAARRASETKGAAEMSEAIEDYEERLNRPGWRRTLDWLATPFGEMTTRKTKEQELADLKEWQEQERQAARMRRPVFRPVPRKK